MPVKFACPACKQWLSISRRKIGIEVHCPKCKSPFVVPKPTAAAKAIAQTNEPANGSAAAPPAIAATLSDRPLPPESSATPRPDAPQKSQPSAEFVVDIDRVSLPRWVLYAQGGLITLVALLGFAGGYWWNRSPAPVAEPVVEQRDAVLIPGQIVYRNARGLKMFDTDAVVVLIPREAVAAQPIDAKGLRPNDPAPSPRQSAVQAIELLDGAYARADREGRFRVVLRPGEYWVLAISRHASRPKGQHVRKEDLPTLERYFLKPADLIGPASYELVVRNVSAEEPLEYDFK